MKKHLSLRWKLTLMTAFMVITACLAISFFISRSAILYMDEIGNSAIAILPNTDIPTTTTDEIQVVLNPKSVVADTVKNTQIEFWIKSLAITLIITLTVSFLMYLIVGYALYPLRELTLKIEDIQANSYHDEALRKVSSELTVVAYASDGIIEGAEVKGKTFALGVQWHPEYGWNYSKADCELWKSFVTASQASRSSR